MRRAVLVMVLCTRNYISWLGIYQQHPYMPVWTTVEDNLDFGRGLWSLINTDILFTEQPNHWHMSNPAR